jgi:chromosome segregation ATPase
MNIEITIGEATNLIDSFTINGVKMVPEAHLAARDDMVKGLRARLADFESNGIWESLAGRDREIADLRADLDHANEARAELGGEVTRLKNTIDALGAEIRHCGNLSEALRNERARLENDNAHLRNDLGCLQHKHDCLEKDYAIAREGESGALAKIEELKAEVADLESQLKSERDASVYRLRVIVSEQAENVRLAKQFQDVQLEAKESERIAEYWKGRFVEASKAIGELPPCRVCGRVIDKYCYCPACFGEARKEGRPTCSARWSSGK